MQQTSSKAIQEQLSGKGDLLRIVPEINADKWYIHKPESVQENEILNFSRDFEIQRDHPILVWRPDLVLINKRMSSCGFCLSEDHKIKDEKLDKYQDIAWELKMFLILKVTVMPIIVGALGIVKKKNEKETGGTWD